MLDDQLGILEAVVQGVMNEEDWADWIVKVDPRPINVSHGPVFLGSAHYLSADSAVISARASVVRDLGATTTSAYPRRRGCTGSLVSPPNRDSSGCPSEKEIVLVLAAEAEVVEGEWTLRMFASFYGTRSSSGGSFDAIVIRHEGGWVLDRLIRRTFWE